MKLHFHYTTHRSCLSIFQNFYFHIIIFTDNQKVEVTMHIKTVTIQGFKFFNERTVVGPFHRGHNVVVGSKDKSTLLPVVVIRIG